MKKIMFLLAILFGSLHAATAATATNTAAQTEISTAKPTPKAERTNQQKGWSWMLAASLWSLGSLLLSGTLALIFALGALVFIGIAIGYFLKK